MQSCWFQPLVSKDTFLEECRSDYQRLLRNKKFVKAEEAAEDMEEVVVEEDEEELKQARSFFPILFCTGHFARSRLGMCIYFIIYVYSI